MGTKGKVGLVLLLAGAAIGVVIAVGIVDDIGSLYAFAADPEASDLDEAAISQGLRRRAFMLLLVPGPLVAAGTVLMMHDRIKRVRSRLGSTGQPPTHPPPPPAA